MNGIFVAGTDTGVGKTLVAACLARYLCKKGLSVATQKWVATGESGLIPSDALAHLWAMGRRWPKERSCALRIAPYVFKAACSPHLASQLEGRRIDPRRIVKSFRILAGSCDTVIVEAAGGVLVPFSRRGFLLDIAKELGLGVLLVVRNRVGAINHALLSLEALKVRKMRLLGVIFNNLDNTDAAVLADNPRIVSALSGTKILGVLPHMLVRCRAAALDGAFRPIGSKIFNALRNGRRGHGFLA